MPTDTETPPETPVLENDVDLNAGVNRMADAFARLRGDEGLPPGAKPEQSQEQVSEVSETPAPEVPAEQKPVVAPESPDVQLDKAPDTMSKAGKENWNRLVSVKNAAVETARKEALSLRDELDKLKESAAIGSSPELEVLKKQKEELESQLERVALENSPRFKSHYDGQIQKSLKTAKAAAGEYGDEVVKLLQEPRSSKRNARLSDIASELGIEGQAIGKALSEITVTTQERDEQLANHRENLKALRQTEASDFAKEMQRRREISIRTLEKARKLPEFTAGTDPKHRAFVDESLSFIEQVNVGKLTPDDAALLPVMAMKGAWLQNFRVPELESKVKSLEARLAQLNGATPKVPGNAPSKGVQKNIDPDKSSFSQKFEDIMAGRT